LKISQIKQHKFFEGFDFESVYYRNQIAPFIPNQKDIEEYKYVDPMLANEKPEDSLYTGFSPIAMKGKN
jgi:hypothetical protein